ncbi:hydroxyisourate hydrolase [soil metagenome]
MSEAPTISTHVLDTEHGQPAVGVRIGLFRLEGGSASLAGMGTTDDDGRIRRLLDGRLEAGEYRIEFEIGGPFFRHAAVTFRVSDAERSYHVPLLLAPYSLATYRGS